MFSEEWDLNSLNQQTNQIIKNLEQEGLAAYWSLSPEMSPLPISVNLSKVRQVVVVCSGYPEWAGVWSYTLLEKSHQEKEALEKTTMAPYFRDLAETEIGLVVLNPHAPDLNPVLEDSLVTYVSQLQQVYEALSQQSDQVQIVLLGFSLGGDAIYRFLQTNPQHLARTSKLVLIDPSPPHVGRRKMNPEVGELVDQALFYGKGTEEGLPDEFAEVTKMRLKIKPELITCQYHGEMPNLAWPRIVKVLPSLFV